jgi:hypothetical protein
LRRIQVDHKLALWLDGARLDPAYSELQASCH